MAALEKIGCSVQLLHTVGGGCYDLLVGRDGFNVVIECKTDVGKLNRLQRDWRTNWRGQADVARNAEEAVAIVLKHTIHF